MARLVVENLEARRCPAGIGFAPNVIALPPGRQGTVADVGDMDADGDLDLVIATSESGGWLENLGSTGFGSVHPIFQDMPPIRWYQVEVGDIDLDGDLDVLTNLTDVDWFENTDGAGTFEHAFTVRTAHALDATLGDLDDDGDLDVAMAFGIWRWSAGDTVWFENIDRLRVGAFGPDLKLRGTGRQYSRTTSVHINDLNGDGLNDILISSRGSLAPCGFLGWTENLGALVDPFGLFQLFDAGNAAESNHLCFGAEPTVVDLDADGDLDLLVRDEHSGIGLWSIMNTDGKGTFDQRQVVIEGVFHSASRVIPADLDNDGDVDLVFDADFANPSHHAKSDRKLAWAENTNGEGAFEVIHIIAEDPVVLSEVADVDGDLDVLAEDESRILLFDSDVAQRSDATGSQEPDGDLNADGIRDVADFEILAANYGKQDAAWADGDLNDDSRVDFTDFLLLRQNYPKPLPPA